MLEELAVLPDELSESSGLAVSRAQPGVLWSHNDSGDGPNVYARGDALIGFAVIAESHIALHAKLGEGLCFAEMFSCLPFDVAAFVEATVRHFGLSEAGSSRWFVRGAE